MGRCRVRPALFRAFERERPVHRPVWYNFRRLRLEHGLDALRHNYSHKTTASMLDPVRRSITQTLQREVDYVAEHATRELMQRWSMAMSGDRPAGVEQAMAGLQGGLEGPQNADELVSMVEAGYRKLGGVVALSVLVDEPGLIADDMHWLERMFGARKLHPEAPAWQDLLLDAYVQACGSVLAEDQVEIVRDVVGRAATALHRNERLEA